VNDRRLGIHFKILTHCESRNFQASLPTVDDELQIELFVELSAALLAGGCGTAINAVDNGTSLIPLVRKPKEVAQISRKTFGLIGDHILPFSKATSTHSDPSSRCDSRLSGYHRVAFILATVLGGLEVGPIQKICQCCSLPPILGHQEIVKSLLGGVASTKRYVPTPEKWCSSC
jgi:hypothetical protein